nr:immunoglobulin light chain junction region [Mus musculus]
CQQSNSWPFTF